MQSTLMPPEHAVPARLRTLLFGTLLLMLTIGLSACDGSDSTGPDLSDEPLETIAVNDLPADPTTSVGPDGRPTGTGEYTFYSLRNSEIVEDSASVAWDIAFQATNILVNGGTSGPGTGAGYVAEAAFEEVLAVDETRLTTDNAEAGTYAVPQGSGNGWYNYNANGQNYVRPIPGRTIVIQTADGSGYAKIRILSYYQGSPELPADRAEHPSRYYTFDYVYQPDGATFE